MIWCNKKYIKGRFNFCSVRSKKNIFSLPIPIPMPMFGNFYWNLDSFYYFTPCWYQNTEYWCQLRHKLFDNTFKMIKNSWGPNWPQFLLTNSSNLFTENHRFFNKYTWSSLLGMRWVQIFCQKKKISYGSKDSYKKVGVKFDPKGSGVKFDPKKKKNLKILWNVRKSRPFIFLRLGSKMSFW